MSDPRLSIIPAGAVTDTRLEPRDLQLLCLLGRHTDDKGWCCRSQVKMARELSCGRATVQRSLERLDDAGWVEHRPEVRSDGGDQAHFYRVILDPPLVAIPAMNQVLIETDSETGGVPTGGQGVPALDGQGVPTHERAPIRTTPVNEPEREGAREATKKHDPKPEDDHEFQRLLKRYPGTNSPNLAFPPWLRLDDEGRRRSLARLDAYLADLRKVGRTSPFSLQRYLGERLFDQVDEPADGKPVQTMAAVRSKEFWLLAYRDAEAGTLRKFSFDMARDQGTGLPVPISELPTAEELAALVAIETDSEAFHAWRRWFGERKLRFRETDTHICGKFIYLPSEFPPGHDPPETEDRERESESMEGEGRA